MASGACSHLTHIVRNCERLARFGFASGLLHRDRLAQSRREGRKSRLCNLDVVLRCIEARADATYHLAVDDDR